MHVINDLLKKSGTAEKYLPVIGRHYTPSVVKIGSNYLLSVIKLEGIPFESINDSQIESKYDSLTRTLSGLSKDKPENLALWGTFCRTKTPTKFDYKFTNTFAKNFAEKYMRRFERGNSYSNSFYLSLILKYTNVDDGLYEMGQLQQNTITGLSSYEPEILGTYLKNDIEFSAVYSFLGYLVNGLFEDIPANISALYSEVVGSSVLQFGFDIQAFHFPDGRIKYATNYDLRTFPTPTESGLSDSLLAFPAELNLTFSFKGMSNYHAIRMIDKQINKLRSAGNEAEHELAEMVNVKGYLTSNEVQFGDFHGALTVFGDTVKEAQDNGISAATKLQQTGGGMWSKATLSAPITFFSHIPLAKDIARPMPKTTRNFAGVFTLHTYSTGKATGNPIGDGSSVMMLFTRANSIFHFNFHVSRKNEQSTGEKLPGSALMLGSTGVGKTTIQSAMLTMLERFNPKYFGIDLDRGMEIFIRTIGGSYHPIIDGEPTGFNPFQLPDTPKNREFLYQLVETCARCASPGEIDATEQKQIKDAVDTVFSLDFAERRFSRLSETIPNTGGNCLAMRIGQWTYAENGRFAWALDCETNDFDPASFWRIGFDCSDVLADGASYSEPVLAYLFHLKELMQEKGGLLVTVIEEFWKPATYPTTEKVIFDGLKTGRKEDEFLFLISQQPEDCVKCKIFEAIVQQTPTKILLPNPDAKYEGGYEKIGLTRKEYDELMRLDAHSRTFLVKQGQQSAFAVLDLSGFDDEIAVLSGTKFNVALLDDIRAEVGNDPVNWMPIFQQRREGKKGVTI